MTEQTTQLQAEKKTEIKAVETKEVKKRNEAIVNGRNLSVSLKYAVAICNRIRRKEIDKAISLLQEVQKLKRAVKMKGEVPHRKGIMSGRYPVKAAGVFIGLLKSLKANAVANDLELEKYEIFCVPNVSPRPYKRFGQGRFKRCHVTLKLIPLKILKKSLSKNWRVKIR